MNANKRNEDIDNYRVAAMILVVLGHAITQEHRTGFLLDLWDVIYSFHMYPFFIISGYLYQKNEARYIQDKLGFVKRKAIQLIIPYVSITCVEYLLLYFASYSTSLSDLLGIGELSLVGFLKALIFNIDHYDTHLWFIYRLFFIYLLNIIASKFCKGKAFISVVLILNLFPNYTAIIFPVYSGLIKWMIPFWIGRRIAESKIVSSEVKPRVEATVALICTGAFIPAFLATRYLTNLEISLVSLSIVRRAGIQVLNIVTGCLGAYVLFVLSRALCRHIKAIQTLALKLRDYTYDIYLFHQPFIAVGIVKVLGYAGCGSISILIGAIASITITYIISRYFVRKNRILKLCFLGMA